jgi:hypothetical protein
LTMMDPSPHLGICYEDHESHLQSGSNRVQGSQTASDRVTDTGMGMDQVQDKIMVNDTVSVRSVRLMDSL